MIVVMQSGASEEQIQPVIDRLVGMGFDIHRSTGVECTVLGCVGVKPGFDQRIIEVLDGVAEVHRISSPYKLVGRKFRPEGTIIQVGDMTIGGDEVPIIAGPCSIESRDQLFTIAEKVAEAGARGLRGGAFKPRTSPYSFQGLGEEGLKLLREVCDHFGLVVVSEVMADKPDPPDGPSTSTSSRSARATCRTSTCCASSGKARKPILLKRGIAATIEELLLSAEYIMAGGNYERHPLRTRHPHLRELHPQHPRRLGHPRRQEALAPAHHRSTPRTAPACATRCPPWPALPSPPAPMASSWKFIMTPTTPSATAPSPSIRRPSRN